MKTLRRPNQKLHQRFQIAVAHYKFLNVIGNNPQMRGHAPELTACLLDEDASHI